MLQKMEVELLKETVASVSEMWLEAQRGLRLLIIYPNAKNVCTFG
jgi:hypothetical protein